LESEDYYHLGYQLLDIEVYSLTTGIIVALVAMGILLVASALVSGSEVAYFSLSPFHRSKLNEDDSRSSTLTNGLLELPERLLATILIANNLINIGIVVLSTYITTSIFDFSESAALGFLFQIVIVTFLILLFGEILPKVYASNRPVRFAKFMASTIFILDKLFWNLQLSRILIKSTSLVNKKFPKDARNLSIDDLGEALELTKPQLSDDKDILMGIIKFGNIQVRDIMKSRVDVIAVDIDTPYHKLIDIIIQSGYSRIPVYEETFDNIKGILYVKDLLPYLDEDKDFEWHALIRPAFFVPESKKIKVLLKEFQTAKIHMALVIDEYGGSSGIITLEDILEEIVGEISDETDDEELNYRMLDEKNYLFEGKTLLNDFYKVLDLDSTVFDPVKGEAETLAGLLLEINGELPAPKDEILYKNFKFSVKSVDNRRIRKIHLELMK
jgi:gliding motility-associated protein GldE